MQPKRHIPGGLFITFEGPECAGKSTQARMLTSWLQQQGYAVLSTREPGGTLVGEELRRIVKHVCGDEAVCDEAELMIFCASRAQLSRKVILPFLGQGGVVICDRFVDSTAAYQGYGRGFDLALIDSLNDTATVGRWPDLTFLLDLDVEVMLQRGQMRLETLFVPDRIEEESRRFHQAVRQGYLELARNNPARIHVVAAAADKDSIQKLIRDDVADAIAKVCR